jgi:deoxyadenosine/deoxycytidine kinase
MFAARDPLYNKFASLRGSIFTIEGVIGVGKSTLGFSMEDLLNSIGLNAKFYPEYYNKELLSQYIGDMKKYAYSFQLVMLFKRLEIYSEAKRFADQGGIAIIDRSIIGDMTFARMQRDNGNITNDEWLVYLSLMKQHLQLSPTANIYLQCTPETSLARIKHRGIKSEIEGYSKEYLKQLQDAYEVSISECTNVKHYKIKWDSQLLVPYVNELKDKLHTCDLTVSILEMLL